MTAMPLIRISNTVLDTDKIFYAVYGTDAKTQPVVKVVFDRGEELKFHGAETEEAWRALCAVAPRLGAPEQPDTEADG